MEAARSIREDFLHQNSFHEVDTYSSLRKQYLLMKLVLAYYEQGAEALSQGAGIQDLVNLEVREKSDVLNILWKIIWRQNMRQLPNSSQRKLPMY